MNSPDHLAYRWVILFPAWILAFFMFATVFTFPPLLEIIRADLSLTYTDTGLLLATPLLLIVLLTIPGGLLVDRIGFKITAGIGSILIGLGGFLRGFSTDFVTLFIFTALFGAGVGICYPNLPKLIGAWFSKEYVGTATGIYLMGLSVGPTVAMALALPFFIPLTGSWRGTFYLWGVGALVGAALWWVLVREAPLQVDGQPLHEDTKIAGLLLKSRYLWMICLTLLFTNMIFYISTGWLPSFYSTMGVEREIANFMASSLILASIPATFLLPVASDMMGLRRPFLWVTMAIAAVASLSLLFTPPEYGWVIAPLLGVTISGPFALVFILPIELFRHEQVGSVSGVVLAAGYLGGFIGLWIVGYLRDLIGSFVPIVYLMVIASIAVIALAFTIPETGRRGARARPPSV